MRAYAGEMRTKITIKAPQYGIKAGFSKEVFVDIFPGPVWCKWANAHGTEVYQAEELHLRQPVTITMRYSPLVNVKCRIWHERDPEPYEIIGIDNVGDRREFLEIKAQRVVTA